MRLQTSSFGAIRDKFMCTQVWAVSLNTSFYISFFSSMHVTFLGFVGEFVAHHVYSDESQERRGEGDKETQIFGHRLLDVSDTQKHNSGIQVHQPVEPKYNENKSYIK